MADAVPTAVPTFEPAPQPTPPPAPAPAPAPAVANPPANPPADPAPAPAPAPAPGAPAPEGGGTADPEAVGAPETYTEFTLPEGMEMNVQALEAFAPLAKELGLSQDQAQKLVAMDAQRQIQAHQAQQQSIDDAVEAWRTETKADPTVGGSNLDKSLGNVRTFLNQFASPALLELLDSTGVGNHVEVIRLFSAAGAAMGEDGVSQGALRPAANKTTAQLFYPNQPV